MFFITFRGQAVPSVSSTVSFTYLCACTPARCIHTRMSVAHRGSSQARVSNPGSAIFSSVRAFILKSHGNGYTTQICLINNSHRVLKTGIANDLHTLPWRTHYITLYGNHHWLWRCLPYTGNFMSLYLSWKGYSRPIFSPQQQKGKPFFQKRKTICLSNKTSFTFLYERRSLVDLFLAKGNFNLA